MSIEQCKLCNEECTPWFHINGHICEECYANTRGFIMTFKIELLEYIDQRIDVLNKEIIDDNDNSCPNYISFKEGSVGELQLLKTWLKRYIKDLK